MEYNKDYIDAAVIISGLALGSYLSTKISLLNNFYNRFANNVNQALHKVHLEYVTRTDTKKNKLERELEIR